MILDLPCHSSFRFDFSGLSYQTFIMDGVDKQKNIFFEQIELFQYELKTHYDY